nr:MAG: hypothetical protein 5 [Guangxi cystovirus 17]
MSNFSNFLFPKPQNREISYPITDVNDINVKCNTTIVDRLAGASVVEKVCGPTPNIGIVAHYMKDDNVRKQVAEFFITNKAVDVIKPIISTQTVVEGEPQTTIDVLLASINSVVKDGGVQAVIAEFMVALAHSRGLIVSGTEMTRVLSYPIEPVSVASLSSELAAQSAVVEFKDVKKTGHFTKRMAKQAYAQAFAETLRPIGYDLFNSRNIQHILDDVVKGVYAHIMSAARPSTLGEVGDQWFSSPVVAELASCYPFIRAAIDGPDGTGVHDNRVLTPKNDVITLEREAPVVLAALKGSRRYNFVSRDEYISTLGKITVSDLDGSPMFFVMYDNAKIQPVAQAVNVFDDSVLSFAKNVVETEDHITRFVAASLPSGRASSLEFHANKLLNAIQHTVETGDVRLSYDAKYFSEEGEDEESSTIFSSNIGLYLSLFNERATPAVRQEIAWLLADEVLLAYDTESSRVTEVFRVKTRFANMRDLVWSSGLSPDGYFVTTNPGMVLLLGRDLTPNRELEPRSQLISHEVFNTRVVGLEESDDRLVAEKSIAFNISVAGQHLSGRLSTFDIGLQDISQYTMFVKALHNAKVTHAIANSFKFMEELESELRLLAQNPIDVGEDFTHNTVTLPFVAFLEQSRVQALVEMSKEVSAQYRATMKSSLQRKAMAALKPEEVFRLRGVLKQKSFDAYVEVIALQMILATCGLEHEYITNTLQSATVASVLLRMA